MSSPSLSFQAFSVNAFRWRIKDKQTTGPEKQGLCMGLCHKGAILSQDIRVALFYLSSLAPKFFTARSREVKQSFFSLSGQYGPRVNKAHVRSDHGRQCECECRLLPQECRACKHVTCERTTQMSEEYACPSGNPQGTQSTTLHCNEFPCQKAKPASGLR